MPSKYNLITDIYSETLNKVTKTPDEWISFLNTASWNYKYDFGEQILIYAQRPDATACADIGTWNTKLKRWVNKGAKGIALLEERFGENRLKYVFDVSDTSSIYRKNIVLWNVPKQYEANIIESLENKFGDLETKDILANAIISVAFNLAVDNFKDYEIDEKYLSMISLSTAYVMLERCKLEPQKYISKNDLKEIIEFNTYDDINKLGTLVSDISEMGLREIQNTIKNLQIEEKNKIRTFENKKQQKYNENISSKNIERSDENDRIQSSERLSNTESSITGREQRTIGQIRTDEATIPKGEQEARVHRIEDEGRTQSTSIGSTDSSKTDRTTTDRENEKDGELDGRTKGKRSNDLDRTNEQSSSESNRDSISGSDIRLDNEQQTLFLTIGEQVNIIKQAEDNTSVLSFTEEEIQETITEKLQFKITDDNLGVGTPKERYRNNIEAIKVLQKCEDENCLATPEEQEILSKYVGWGGLPDVFDKDNSSWTSEYIELKNLLTEEEYTNARESTLTAFYTPPLAIKSIYKALSNVGFTKGNILEPSCGTGNFIGMLPDNMQNSKIYGVELDSISGKIAKQLYQKSNIQINGFEKVDYNDNFFDVAVGNVPFGNFKLADRRYDKNNFLIHDYFFAKTLDKVRPNGIIAFITSKGTLDKENDNIRKYISERAEFIGAIRLPDNTFKANAGTEVTSDIIFLQKRDHIENKDQSFVKLGKTEDNIEINQYFVEHPEMIVGKMKMGSTRYGFDSACKLQENQNFEELLNVAIQNIKAQVTDYTIDDDIEKLEDTSIPANENVRNFSYVVIDNKIYFRENSKMNLQEMSITAENRVKGMIAIRESVRKLIELQTEDFPDDEIEQEQHNLNTLYDNFTKKYGLINSRGNSSVFSDDSSYCLLCSLEILDNDGNLKQKADMFSKRTIKPHKNVTRVDTASEALAVSIAEKGKIDLSFMLGLTDMYMDKMVEDLKGVIFRVPVYGDPNVWVTADEYLSGNVREKLEMAKIFAKDNTTFEINVERLEQVIPKDLTASEINVKLRQYMD